MSLRAFCANFIIALLSLLTFSFISWLLSVRDSLNHIVKVCSKITRVQLKDWALCGRNGQSGKPKGSLINLTTSSQLTFLWCPPGGAKLNKQIFQLFCSFSYQAVEYWKLGLTQGSVQASETLWGICHYTNAAVLVLFVWVLILCFCFEGLGGLSWTALLG